MATTRSTSSSPDPLSRSIDRLWPASSPVKGVRSATPRRIGGGQGVLRESSPNIARSRSVSPSKYSRLSSPFRAYEDTDGNSVGVMLERGQSVLLSTPGKQADRANGAVLSSPLRIRLTVEADEDDDDIGQSQYGQSQVLRYDGFEKTTTITIPLKGEDEHRPVKRRLRRRRSIITSSAEKSAVDDILAGATSPSPSPARKRARRSASPSKSVEPQTEAAGKTPSKRGRGRPRKSPAPTLTNHTPTFAAAAALKPHTLLDFTNLTPLHLKQAAAPTPDDLSMFNTQLKRSDRIRNRKPTPRKPAGWVEVDESSVAGSSPVRQGVVNRVRGSSVLSPSFLRHEDDVEEQDQDDTQGLVGDEVEEEEEGNRTGLEDDTTMLDRSAIESEGFSMVSIDSLRYQRKLAEAGIGGDGQQEEISASAHATPDVDVSRLSPAVIVPYPNSPPSSSPREHHLTPQKSPSQIMDNRGEAQDASGMVKTPQAEESTRNTQPSSSPARRTRSSKKRKSEPAVFEAFGTGTKRHLRAGLAMGELLARNEKGFTHEANSTLSNVDNMENLVEDSRLSAPRPRLPTPAASVDSSFDATTAGSSTAAPENRQGGSAAKDPRHLRQDFSSSPMKVSPRQQVSDTREATMLSHTQLLEREFQKEREEVIRQAQAANTSQVIVIDTEIEDESHVHSALEDEDEEEDEENETIDDIEGTFIEAGEKEDAVNEPDPEPTADIWREEADRSLTEEEEAPRPSQPLAKITKAQRPSEAQVAPLQPAPTLNRAQQRRRAREQEQEVDRPNSDDLFVPDLRPARAKLPRTWRRVSGNDFHYSDEMETPGAPEVKPADKETESPVIACIPEVVREPRLDDMALPGSSPPQAQPINPIAVALPHNDEVAFSEGEEESVGENDAEVEQEESYIPLHAPSTSAKPHSRAVPAPAATQDDSTALQTSDVRQLRYELRASVGLKARRAFGGARKVAAEEEDVHSSVLQAQPGKTYAKLFEDVPPPAAGAIPSKSSAPSVRRKMQPNTKRASHKSTSKNMAAKVTAPSTSLTAALIQAQPLKAPVAPVPSVGLFTRLTSFLFFANTTALTPPPTMSAPKMLVWNRNHYLLLDHYHALSLSLSSTTSTTKSRGPPLPQSYNDPLTTLPKALLDRLGQRLCTKHPLQHPPGKVSERWIRVVWAWMEEVKGRGVPLLCDGSLHGPAATSTGQDTAAIVAQSGQDKYGEDEKEGSKKKYPLRDEKTGKVLRQKEDWKGREWDVLRHLYSLSVRDALGGVLAPDILDTEMADGERDRVWRQRLALNTEINEKRELGNLAEDGEVDEELGGEVATRTAAWVCSSS